MFRLNRDTTQIPDSNVSGQVAVIMPARNEENNISNSLKSLVNQKLKPYRIIVINDGSTDKTGEIASSFKDVEVVDIEPHENYVAKKELAITLKAGFDKLQDDTQCQYVLITGGDIIYPENYLSTIVTRMNSNSNIAVASGIIAGEYYREPTGPGRVVNVKFWRKIGFYYPVNYAYESYLLWKAQSMGYDLAVYQDLVMHTQRKTGSAYKPNLYYYYGMGYKAMGYIWPYYLYKTIFFARKKPKAAFYYLKGYLSNYKDFYEPELREYVRKTQWNKLKNISRKDLKLILKYLGIRKKI